MAEPKTPEKGGNPGSTPESPTTARELDFDDEPQEPANVSSDPNAKPGATTPSGTPKPGSGEDAAPPKPPRPMSPQQQAVGTLKEAFPAIEESVVRAVLTASGGKVEPAFNALLSLSDPKSQEAQEAQAPPSQTPQRNAPLVDSQTSTAQSQLEADEMYARQLAEHYNAAPHRSGHRGGSRSGREQLPSGAGREMNLKPNELYDDDHSFFDDDLPVIKENIRKGFFDTQTKVSKWVTDFRKRIEGDEEDDEHGSNSGYTPRPQQQQQPFASRRSAELGRRSGDRERYDADPRVLSDDFTALEMRDDESPPPRPARPSTNARSTTPSGRKVSFQDGPPEEIEPTRKPSPRAQSSPRFGSKQSKWQPLSAVEPTPAADNDPFSLGDSDDDKEAKSQDLKSEDSERLKKAAAEAMSDDIGLGEGKGDALEEQKKTSSGTKDQEAEKKLTGKA